MGCQERRGGRMGSWSDLVWIIHGRLLESAALLGFHHLGSLGKRIKLALANSLMHYLSSTLCFERNVAKGRKIHGPTPSSPPRRNYEISLALVSPLLSAPLLLVLLLASALTLLSFLLLSTVAL